MDKDILELKNNPYKYAENISINKLEKIIEYLSDKYYNTGKNIIPDKIYDGLLEILKKRDPNNVLLGKVGAITKRSIKLPYFIGSLDKIKPDTEVIYNWVKTYKGPYTVSDKLDGISCILVKYSFGIKLYTRGNGWYGSDITHLKNYVIDDNINIDKIPEGSVIRGELIITKDNFKTIEQVMENARNAVSGLTNSKKINENVAKITEFITYNIINQKYKHSEQLKLLKDYRFKTVNYKKFKLINNDILSDYLIERRKNSLFDIDGLVVVDDSTSYDVVEGYPEYAFAFKSILTNESAEVQVIEVIWNISKDSYLKPKIKINPVRLAGVKISSLTGFNAKYIYSNKIGPGSILKICRSGDVIPHILEVIEPSSNNDPQMPNMEFEWTKTDIDIIVKKNKNSKVNNDVKVKQLTFFFKTLDIKNIDEKTIQKLVENNINNIFKILTCDKQDIISINGIGNKLLTKIRENMIDKLKTTNMEALMTASQLFGRGIGKRKIKNILNVYPNILEITDSKDVLITKINSVNGFNTLTSTLFVNGLSEFKNFFNKLNKIVDLNYLIKAEKIKAGILFKDQNIVFTGFRDKNLEKFIEINGGQVKTSISSKTTLLIYNDNSTNSNKINEAKKLEIKILSQSEFKQKYNIS